MANNVNNDEEYIEHDSLSDESSQVKEEEPGDKKRRGSYTLESSTEMSTRIHDANLTQAIYVDTDPDRSSETTVVKTSMSQSLYERPSRSKLLLSAVAKKREEKIRLAKEEQDRNQKLRLIMLSDSEKVAENIRRRKEAELMKRIEENKKKAMERQKIVEERKERLKKAEEARRKALLRKLVNNTDKKPSPQSSDTLMTMSCYGGFGGPRSRHGNKEVVQNRFLNSRPLSSTGKIIGFGSSTPRPICENTIKSHVDGKKIPESILQRCELLSKPNLSRASEKMIQSVIAPQVPNNVAKKPQRQTSLVERPSSTRIMKQSPMTTSTIQGHPMNKPKYNSNHKSVLKSETINSQERPHKLSLASKSIDAKRFTLPEKRSSSSSSNHTTKSQEVSVKTKVVQAKSATFPRNARKKKVDSHLDSDSIEEEGSTIDRSIKVPRSIMSNNGSHHAESKPKVQIVEKAIVLTNEELNNQMTESTRAPPTKDLSESEYKNRLMENRRLVREKREREREELMKKEREKRHADEVAARELMEMEREKHIYVDETHLTTSNEDTLGGVNDHNRDNHEEEEESHLSEIPEVPVSISVSTPQESKVGDDEKFERKKKVESIMSRVRKVNDESSSEGGVSPRRAMSPEPAELEANTNPTVATPAFRSSLLQTMMSKGRLTKTPIASKEVKAELVIEDHSIASNVTTSAFLTSVRESVEDSESLTSPPPSATSNLCVDLSTLQDIKLDPDTELTNHKLAIQDLIREDCDGKEDSLSLDEARTDPEREKTKKLVRSSLSSADTEEEEIIKAPFTMKSVYSPMSTNPLVQEGCVFEN